jgi:hypothetical protein
LIVRTRLMVSASRVALAGMVTAGILVLSLGVAVPGSGAAGTYSASESAFCKTMFSFKETAPKGSTLDNYKTWAKTIIPLYEKLASEAPNAASKKVLNQLVTILKDYQSASSLSGLKAYEVANHASFLKNTKAFTAVIVACAKTL